MNDSRLRTAAETDVKFLESLAKKFTNQIGFLPRVALGEYAARGWSLIGKENGTEAGYLLGRPSYRYQRLMRPITQAAVAMDAQRRALGLALVREWCEGAAAAGQLAVQCSCANDIDAMHFWPAAGFERICEVDPKNARGRLMTIWRKQVTPLRPDWFETPPPVAGFRAVRCTQTQSFLFPVINNPMIFKR